MKLYKIVSTSGAFSYIVLGFLTIGGLIHNSMELHLNLIMGVLFIACGYYLYSKARSTIKLVTEIKEMSNEKGKIFNSVARFFLFEKIFVSITLLLGILLLSGAVYRVFEERLPLFG